MILPILLIFSNLEKTKDCHVIWNQHHFFPHILPFTYPILKPDQPKVYYVPCVWLPTQSVSQSGTDI